MANKKKMKSIMKKAQKLRKKGMSMARALKKAWGKTKRCKKKRK